jgi:hypothetical protein
VGTGIGREAGRDGFLYSIRGRSFENECGVKAAGALSIVILSL